MVSVVDRAPWGKCVIDMRVTYGSGYPQRLGILENKNGHGKVMEHDKLAKSLWILWNLPNLCILVTLGY